VAENKLSGPVSDLNWILRTLNHGRLELYQAWVCAFRTDGLVSLKEETEEVDREEASE